MKKIYFNLQNGAVVDPPESLPAYYALVSKGKVKEVYACFSVNNIQNYDSDWVKNSLADKLERWDEWNPNLIKLLHVYVNQPRFWFKDTNHIEKSYDRFIYIRFK